MRTSAMTHTTAPWELEFDWHLTNRCNFFCEYCHPQIRYVLNKKHLNEPDPQLVVRRFEDIGKTSLIHMSGGEPYMFPGFVDLCIGLTRNNYISINSNLASGDVPDFANLVPADRVAKIVAAIHMPERERLGAELEVYAYNLQALRSQGFDVVPLYVLWPPLLGRFRDDIEKLRALGVEDVRAKVFKGVYQQRRYPEGYSDAEKDLILASSDYVFNRPYLDGMMSFRGQACTAGVSSFKVTVTGEVRRCASVATSYGNLYDGTFLPAANVEPCPANRVLVVSQCLSYLVDPPAHSPADLEEED